VGGAIFKAKFVVFARDLRKAALILSRCQIGDGHDFRSNDRKGTGLPPVNYSLLHSKAKDFSNPHFWAAFTLTRQWR